MNVSIGFDNFEILKIDDRDFTVEINAYIIVKWKDARIIIDFPQVSKNLLSTNIQGFCFCKPDSENLSMYNMYVGSI